MKLVCDECMWFNKLMVQTIIDKNHKILQNITVDNDQRTHSTYVKQFNTKNMMQMSSSWNEKKDLQTCWFKFIVNLWPVKYENRLSCTYYKCLILMQNTLSDHWINAIEQHNWQPYFEALLGINKSKKYLLKSHLPDLFGRSAIAMQTIISFMIKSYPPVQTIHDSSNFWSINVTWEAIKFAISVWPSILKHYWKPQVYIDWKYLLDKNGLGLYTFYYGWQAMFGITHPDKFVDIEHFLDTIMPWDLLLCEARKTKIPIVQDFEYTEINNIKWNSKKNSNHDTCKFSTLQHVILTILLHKHRPVLMRLYGNAQFAQNATFTSKAITNQLYDESIGLIFQSLQPDSIHLTDEEHKAIEETLNNLHEIQLDMNHNPVIPGLTYYSRSFADKCMYAYICLPEPIIFSAMWQKIFSAMWQKIFNNHIIHNTLSNRQDEQ